MALVCPLVKESISRILEVGMILDYDANMNDFGRAVACVLLACSWRALACVFLARLSLHVPVAGRQGYRHLLDLNGVFVAAEDKVHKIRITLTSKKVKALEKGLADCLTPVSFLSHRVHAVCEDLIKGAKQKRLKYSGPVRMPTKVTQIAELPPQASACSICASQHARRLAVKVSKSMHSDPLAAAHDWMPHCLQAPRHGIVWR